MKEHTEDGLYAVCKALFVEFPHGVFGVANFDRDLFVGKFVAFYFSDDFAVVFVAIRPCVDSVYGAA